MSSKRHAASEHLHFLSSLLMWRNRFLSPFSFFGQRWKRYLSTSDCVACAMMASEVAPVGPGFLLGDFVGAPILRGFQSDDQTVSTNLNLPFQLFSTHSCSTAGGISVSLRRPAAPKTCSTFPQITQSTRNPESSPGTYLL